jgi:hypothetical protein
VYPLIAGLEDVASYQGANNFAHARNVWRDAVNNDEIELLV